MSEDTGELAKIDSEAATTVPSTAIRAVQMFSNSAMAVQRVTRKSVVVFTVSGLALGASLLLKTGIGGWSVGLASLVGLAACLPAIVLAFALVLMRSVAELPNRLSGVLRDGQAEIKSVVSPTSESRKWGPLKNVRMFLSSTWGLYGASKEVRGLLGDSAAFLRFANPLTAAAIGISYAAGSLVTVIAVIVWLVVLF